jgi:peptidoglycan/LPS O-acetylase OafA/YrhL
VFIGLVLLPFAAQHFNIQYNKPYQSIDVWWMFVFMVPYISNFIYGHHFLQALWSIGVEENFYLFWAPLVKKFYAHLTKITACIYVGWLLLVCFANNSTIINELGLLHFLVNHLQFEALALGALGAALLQPGNIDDRFFGNKFIQAIIYCLVLTKFLFIEMDYYMLRILMEPGFIYIILNTAFNPNAILKFNFKIMDKLGDYSYGIYIYHVFVIGFTIKFIHHPLLSSLVSFCLVLAVSWISKHIFENRFLRLKPY